MNIQSVFSSQPIFQKEIQSQTVDTSQEAQRKFTSFLKEAIEQTNTQQIQSDKLTQRFVMGDNVELHEVMIAAQKASISLNATMEVRNKIVEAYQEISRMQV